MPDSAQASRRRQGVGFGLAAYGIWGAVPLFWPLVSRAGAIEILAHRIVWSLVLALVLLRFLVPLVDGRSALGGWWARVGNRRTLLLLGAASAVVALNWGTYIWAVNSGQVVETALGYYINPILSILVGVLALRERLSPAQWVSVGLAGVAVVVLTLDYGRLPWIALVLAVSFATYGVIKNRLGAGAVDSLVVESALLTPVALVYLGFLQVAGAATFGRLGWGHSLLLVATGVITLVPLLFFAGAVTRLPLSLLGLLQYLAPTLQFILGITWFGEAMSPGRWVGFGLVWLALVIMSADGLRRAQRSRAAQAKPVVEPAQA